MKRRYSIIGLALAMLLGAAVSPASAQNDGIESALASALDDPNLNPSLAPEPRVVYGASAESNPLGPVESDAAWGTQQGATWIAASQFTVRLFSTAPVLTYAGNHFYAASGTAGSQRYYAQLDVEPGVRISHLTCVYNDSSAADNVGFSWQKYTTDLSAGTSSSETLDSFVTSGTPGVDFEFLTPPAAETMSTTDGSFDLINHYIAADVTAATSIAGCWAFWNRQVAPAPSTATFNDVPTGHAFFQHIEALVGSGITGGCGGGNYCPNAPLTRGQMAVFLAKALGLGFQY